MTEAPLTRAGHAILAVRPHFGRAEVSDASIVKIKRRHNTHIGQRRRI